MIIDFHVHTFPDKIAARVVDKLGLASASAYFSDGSAAALSNAMKKAGIDYCVNLPVMTSVEQVEKINRAMIAGQETMRENGILTFGGMHPDYPNYKEELRHLKACGIKGIKLHPAYQSCDIDDPRMLRIIDAASELDLIVLTHAGLDIGILDHNYADVPALLHVIEQVRPPKFVLAHMGGWAGWEEVERDLAGAPVWLDTAFSLGEITPREGIDYLPCRLHNLEKEDFVRLARKHGTDKILFATDSPWSDLKLYVDWIADCGLKSSELAQIYAENACALLQLR